jgi:hypothetical protein
VSVSSTIRGSQAVSVGGRAITATVVDSVLHITGGAIDLTIDQRDWVAPSYGLVLEDHATTTGTAYGTSYSSDVTRKLRSTSPSG